MIDEKFSNNIKMLPLSNDTRQRGICEIRNESDNIFNQKIKIAVGTHYKLIKQCTRASSVVRYIRKNSEEEEVLFCRILEYDIILKESLSFADICVIEKEFN